MVEWLKANPKILNPQFSILNFYPLRLRAAGRRGVVRTFTPLKKHPAR